MDVAIWIALVAAIPPAVGWIITVRKHRSEARSIDVEAQSMIIDNLMEHNGWLKQQFAPSSGNRTVRQEMGQLSTSVEKLTELVVVCVEDHKDLRASIDRMETQLKGQ